MRQLIKFIFWVITVLALNGCETENYGAQVFPLAEKTMAAGYSHNCIIKKDETVACFDGYFINRNDANFEDINKTALKAKALSAGLAHTCAILLDDTVKCWNDKQKVSFGPTEPFERNLRANFDEIENAKVLDIAAGYFHTCAVKASNNQIQCWGDDSRNQIKKIKSTFNGKKVKSITAGAENICAIMMDDTVLCSNEPSGFHKIAHKKVKAIKANGDHACAITLNDDKLICWGKTPIDQQDTFVKEIQDEKVLAMALGEEHVCAILAKDTVMHCWGDENYAPLISPIIKDKKYKSVFAGRFHTCALDFDDRVKCSGFDAALAHIKDIQGEVLKYVTAGS